jgi:hypothetical protein
VADPEQRPVGRTPRTLLPSLTAVLGWAVRQLPMSRWRRDDDLDTAAEALLQRLAAGMRSRARHSEAPERRWLREQVVAVTRSLLGAVDAGRVGEAAAAPLATLVGGLPDSFEWSS